MKVALFLLVVIVVIVLLATLLPKSNKDNKQPSTPVKLSLAPSTTIFLETTTISPKMTEIPTTTITPETTITTITPETTITTITPETTTMISYDANNLIVAASQSTFMPSSGSLTITEGVWQITFSVQYQVDVSTTSNSLWIRVYVGSTQVNQVNTDIPIVTETTTGTVTGTVTVTSTTSQNVVLMARTAASSTNIIILSSSDSTKNSYLQCTLLEPLTTTPIPST